jgi:hypothetical protein
MLHCLHTQAPKDDELLRYALEGDPLPHAVEEHIASCNSCRQELASLISTNSSLLHKLYRSQCPDITILARYSAGLASLGEGLSVLYHLSSCPLCTQELWEMRKALDDDLL